MCIPFYTIDHTLEITLHNRLCFELWICVYDPTKDSEVKQNNCFTLQELRQAVKPNYNCSWTCADAHTHAHIHKHTVIFNLSLDFCTMSYKLSSSHWRFFANIIRDFMSGSLHRGYLTEWTTEKETVTEKEKHATKTGRSSDSKL